MQQLLHPVCLALAAAGFLLLLASPQRLRQDRARAALAGVYGFCACSFLVSLEPVWQFVGGVTGRPSIGILMAFGFVTAQVALQSVVLAHWALSPDRARARARLFLTAGGVVVLALTTLFFLLPAGGPTTPQGFTATYIRYGVYQTYLVLYVVAYGIGQGVLGVGCWRAAGRTEEVWIARGLRVVGTGALLTLGYSAIRLAAVAAAASGSGGPSAATESLAWVFADIGNLLVLTGFFIPTLAVHTVLRMKTWLRTHRDYRALAPLWSVMHDVVPGIVLEPQGSVTATRSPSWGTAWRLYRRAVEIRDGQWALRHYLEESVRRTAEERHRAAGLVAAELAAAVTADQLHSAVAAYVRGDPALGPAEYADARTRESLRTPDDDVRALLRIAARFNAGAATEEAAPART
ncbi:MAB_1171c family putative transporter [Streptomyces sp. NPDC059538]|uniref:MAB_1171c family putative transporter n=1 Tax=Streptomyces sp. NPDC059538 TaxID=3346860 RepID=UPI0036BE798C